MDDNQFVRELEIYCFIRQIDGYGFGDKCRSLDFHPIVPMKGNPVNREATLAMCGYEGFSDEQRAALLDRA